MSKITKDQFIRRLQAIINQVQCESTTKFNESFQHNEIVFDYFTVGEQSKTQTIISMRKIEID
jgi:hypothetical protein